MAKRSFPFLSVLSFVGGIALCVALALSQEVTASDAGVLLASYSLFGTFLVVLLTAALMFCGERKWALLAHAWTPAAQKPPAAFLRRHYLWQNWAAQFVPPALAIVIGRGLASRRMPGGTMQSGIISGLFDQATDFILLCALLPGSFLFFFAGAGSAGFVVGAMLGVLLVAAMGAGLRRFCPEPLRTIFWPLFHWSLARALLTLWRLLIGVLALGLAIPLLPVAALTPVVSFVALIPLTPGNLGLAEWGWVGGLAADGVDAHEAALYALGFRLLVLVAQTLLLGLNEAYEFYVARTAVQTTV